MNVDRLSPEELQRTMQHQRYQTTQGYINLGRLLKPSALKVYVPPTGDTGQAGQEAG